MPVDGSAFREIEEKYLYFKNEPHNVRLSLAANGVNPFGELMIHLLQVFKQRVDFSCPVCGPKMKYRHFPDLRKMVFD